MLTFTKVLHITGVAMFLGSLSALLAAGQLPGVGSEPAATLAISQAIDFVMRFVTLPGLVLAVFSGVFLALMKYFGVFRRRWLIVHQLLGLLVIAITAVVLVPTGGQMMAAATAFAQATGTHYAFSALQGRAEMFGALNLVILVAAAAVGVAKPRLGQRWRLAPQRDAAVAPDRALKA